MGGNIKVEYSNSFKGKILRNYMESQATYPTERFDGSGNLVNILANMFVKAESGSRVRMVDTPETVYRVMQHPEFVRAMARGVHVEAILVQTGDPRQKPYLQAIQTLKTGEIPEEMKHAAYQADYARRLEEVYKKGGVEGVANLLTQTMTMGGRPLSRKEAMEMAEEGERNIYGKTLKYKFKQVFKKLKGKN